MLQFIWIKQWFQSCVRKMSTVSTWTTLNKVTLCLLKSGTIKQYHIKHIKWCFQALPTVFSTVFRYRCNSSLNIYVILYNFYRLCFQIKCFNVHLRLRTMRWMCERDRSVGCFLTLLSSPGSRFNIKKISFRVENLLE